MRQSPQYVAVVAVVVVVFSLVVLVVQQRVNSSAIRLDAFCVFAHEPKRNIASSSTRESRVLFHSLLFFIV